MDKLKGSVGGGRGGRGGRGRKRGGKKGMRDTQAIWIGQGVCEIPTSRCHLLYTHTHREGRREMARVEPSS